MYPHCILFPGRKVEKIPDFTSPWVTESLPDIRKALNKKKHTRRKPIGYAFSKIK